MQPEGMYCDAALVIMLRSCFSPMKTSPGGSRALNFSSVSARNPSQLAFLKLMKALCSGFKKPTSHFSEMMIGRWFEPSALLVDHYAPITMLELMRLMSRELVELEVMLVASDDDSISSAIMRPRVPSATAEFQSVWCALKSPTIMAEMGFLNCCYMNMILCHEVH